MKVVHSKMPAEVHASNFAGLAPSKSPTAMVGGGPTTNGPKIPSPGKPALRQMRKIKRK